MTEERLDKELERIYRNLPFLWLNYDFHIKYLTRDYGLYNKGFILGLENKVFRMILIKETSSQREPIIKRVGTKSSLFTPPDYSYLASNNWHPITGLTYWLTGVQYESDKDVDKDLENFSQYLKLYIDKLLDLFKSPDELDSRLEQLRNQNKDNQLTVDKIKAERARLQALGQDSSLEAAINSLRGGKK